MSPRKQAAARASGPAASKGDEAEGWAFGFERCKRVKGIEAHGPQTLAAAGRRPRKRATREQKRRSRRLGLRLRAMQAGEGDRTLDIYLGKVALYR